MALVVKTLPGVYGGVSNQTASLRKDNQVSEMINCNPSLVSGTTRRPNAEAGVITIPQDADFIYDYQRSNEEAVLLTINPEGELKAQTVGQGEKTVEVAPEVQTYLEHENKQSLSGITIGDTTYIVNNEKVVETEMVKTTAMDDIDELYLSDVTIGEEHFEKVAYYWLSRSSNDADHPYNYVVELDDVKYEAENDKADIAAELLAAQISSVVERTTVNAVENNSTTFTLTLATGSGFEVEGFDGEDNDSMVLTPNADKTSWQVQVVKEDSEFSDYTLYIGGQYITVIASTVEDTVDAFIAKFNKVHEIITTAENPNGYNAIAVGSVVRIWKDDLSEFKFNYWDSWGSLASYGWQGSVGKLQDLPSSFPWDGAVVKINSSDGDVSTDYYVIRWDGTWQEYNTRGEFRDGIRYLPLLKNMPIVIERRADDVFEARLLTTSDQLKPPLVGNETNNKDPYFVGKKIKQLFYINGRICIVSGDALTFSQTDVLWNFYATTIINLLDGDTIEVKIASEKVLEILRVAIFQSGLLIMSSEGQYIFNTEQGISPSTVIVNKLSNYAYNDTGGTVYDGDSIVFSGSTGDTARLYRYRVARLTSENKAIDLTIQVPTYIQGEVIKITNFVEDGTLIVLTEGSKSVYLYREVISGDQMVQSSWYRWDFSNLIDHDILHIMVIDAFLYIVTVDGVFKIPLGTHVFEPTYRHEDVGGVPYVSSIELTKWRPKKTQAQVQTPRGRLQLRSISVALEGGATLEIYKEDRDFTQNKPITHNKSINVLSNTDKTVLSIKNDGLKPFTISGIAYSGTYREKGKEQI